MSYRIIPSKKFLEQIKKINQGSKEIIEEKIELIKQNPFRYKKINSKKFSRVFRVRMSIDRKETRLIYVVMEPNVVLVCLLDRKKDYKDLEKYLDEIK